MPFTPSHAVIALPFVRTPLVPAAIAIGAMTPDLPLFVRGLLPIPYGRTHDLAWLPFTVAIAFVLLLLWRCVLRPAVRELSPRALAVRLPEEWDAAPRDSFRETIGFAPDGRFRLTSLVLVLVSSAIGVVSHIVWDLFTHEGRWGVELIPLLDEQWGPFTGFKWVQYASSGLGLLIIAVWMAIWIAKRDSAAPLQRVLPSWVRWSWWMSLPIVLVVAGVGRILLVGPLDAAFGIDHLGYRVLLPACGVWGAITVALAVVISIARRRITGPATRAAGHGVPVRPETE